MNKVIDNMICSTVNNIHIIKNTQNKYKYRLLKELTMLEKINDLHINVIDENTININIILNDRMISSFNIVIDKLYPFSCPQVLFFLNNETDTSSPNYIKLLALLNCYNFKIKLHNSDLECICCSTLICKDNWHPKKTLKDIIDEIKIIIKHIGKKRKEILLKKILKKKLGYVI